MRYPLPFLPSTLAGYEIMNCPSIRLHGGSGSSALFTAALLWARGSPNGNDSALAAHDEGEKEGRREKKEKDCLGSHEHKFGLIGAHSGGQLKSASSSSSSAAAC